MAPRRKQALHIPIAHIFHRRELAGCRRTHIESYHRFTSNLSVQWLTRSLWFFSLAALNFSAGLRGTLTLTKTALLSISLSILLVGVGKSWQDLLSIARLSSCSLSPKLTTINNSENEQAYSCCVRYRCRFLLYFSCRRAR